MNSSRRPGAYPIRYFSRALSLLAFLALASLIGTVTHAVNFSDDFNDGARDTARWQFGVLDRDPSYLDLQVPVSERDGRLQITLLAGVASTHYNGYLSTGTWDLTGASAGIEVRQISSGGDTVFVIGTDNDNWYRFRAVSGKLYLEYEVRGSRTSQRITYNSTSHRYWRIRHDQSNDTVVYETSADRGAWVAQLSVARRISVTALRININAGTYKLVANPSAAIFDSFRLEPGSTTPAPTSTPAPTPTATPTPTPTPAPTPTPTPTPAPPPPSEWPSEAGDFYVSPTGSDTNPGTEALPFRTIQKAASVVNPGQLVIVEDGVYTYSGSGTSSRPIVQVTRSGSATGGHITFRSRNRWGAVLDGSVNNATSGFKLVGTYIKIEGFEIKNTVPSTSGASGIEFYSGGNHSEANFNWIHHIGRVCTTVTNGLTGIFIGDEFNVSVDGNLIHDIGRYAPGENGCNVTTNDYQNHDHGFYISGVGGDITVKNNVLFNINRGWAFHLYRGTMSNLAILNNTVYGQNPWRTGHVVLNGISFTNLRIQNNIFSQPNTAGLRILATNTFSGSCVVSHNLTTASAMTDAVPIGLMFSNNQISTNPLFINAAARDFHLQPASPAINSGTSLWEVTSEFDRNHRPAGGAHDKGAFEWAP